MISLMKDGVFAGVGGVLSFVPNIFILFLSTGTSVRTADICPESHLSWTALWTNGPVRKGIYSDASGIRMQRAGSHGIKGSGR